MITSRVAQRRELAEQRIRQRALLTHIDQHEHDHLVAIVDRAITSGDEYNRWQTYEELKRQMKQVVGWGAVCSELRTDAHYAAMIDFLDWLLPAPSADTAHPSGAYLFDLVSDRIESERIHE